MPIRPAPAALRLRLARFFGAPAAPAFARPPALDAAARIGRTLTVSAPVTGRPAPEPSYQWYRNGAAIAGATAARFTPRPEDDLSSLSCRVAAVNRKGRVEAETAARIVRYAPPEAAGDLGLEIFDKDSGDQLLPLGRAFRGANLSFSVAGPAGVSIDPATGVVALPTDTVRDGAVIRVLASNSGGTAESRLTMAVEGEESADTAPTELRDRVEKNGVSFVFDQAYAAGRYCNGDWFIVAPDGGRLVATTPESTTGDSRTEDDEPIAERTVNGMMVNPGAHGNGFDSFTGLGSEARVNSGYDAAANIDPGHTAQAYAFAPGETLVKAVSLEAPPGSARTTVMRYVTLTIVADPPAADAFRPPVGGDFKDVPASWRLARIDWSRVPELQLDALPAQDIDWEARATAALETWQTWRVWGNGARNIVPAVLSGPYRRELGREIGRCLQALTVAADRETKRDVMIGMIQLGIDQCAGAYHYNAEDPDNTSENNRWDIGRRAPTALAALLLPDSAWIAGALENRWRWQDISSYGVITREVIDAFDDDTEPGAAAGMEGFGDWIAARPSRVDGVSPSNAHHALAREPLTETYRKIGHVSQFVGVSALHLFEGGEAVFDGAGVVRFNDRWDALVAAGWPGLGDAQGYQVSGNRPATEDYDYFRAVRAHMAPAPAVLTPERPEPPELARNGTQIVVTPVSPYVGHGAEMTRMDVRYRALETDGTPAQDWVIVEDVTLDANGRYIISPEPTGGLAENTDYAVGIRHHNATGAGAWSRNWSYGDEAWSAGMVRTAETLAPVAPRFAESPALESYFVAGRPVRMQLGGVTGFPAPGFAYQWKLDGTDVAGATDSTFTPGDADTGATVSVSVTATNTEGSATTLVTGPRIADSVAPTGYTPTRYATEGVTLIRRAGGSAPPLLCCDIATRCTTAFWWSAQRPARFNMHQGRTRTDAHIAADGRVIVNLRGRGASDSGEIILGPVDVQEFAWYLLSIDTRRPDPAERIRLYRRPETSPYPPQRVPVHTIVTPVPQGAGIDPGRARDDHFVFSPADVPQEFADYWHRHGMALEPGSFFNASGDPIDIDSIRGPDIRVGGGMGEEEMNARRNSGRRLDPLPAADETARFEAVGAIILG